MQRPGYTRIQHLQVKTAQYAVNDDGITFRKRRLLANKEQENPVLVIFGPKGVTEVIGLFTKEPLQTYELEPIRMTRLFASASETRTLVKFEDVPRQLVNAVLAIEDRRFYDHGGIDLRSIGRALNEDIFGSGRLGFTQSMAGKTGTTNDFGDSWFVGYTPDLICLVWVGYDDNTSLKMNGAQAALPIWAAFMKKAVKTLPIRDFVAPSGIVTRMIDPTTGKLASGTCTHRVQELSIEGTEPQENCSDYYHSLPLEYFTSQQARLRNSSTDNVAVALSVSDNSEFDRFKNQPAYLALKPALIQLIFTNESTSPPETGGQRNHD